MKRNVALAGACLTFMIARTALPAFAHPDETYTLKRVFKAGEADRYRNVFTIESGNTKLQITFTSLEKTEEMKDDGTMVRSITIETAEFEAGGRSMPMPRFKPVKMTATIDKDGNVIKHEGEGGLYAMLLSLSRPLVEAEQPLKVGQAWKTEIPTDRDEKKKLDVTVTLVSLEPKSDEVPVETYKVKTTAEGVMQSEQGDQQVKSEAVSLVTRDTCKLVKTEGIETGMPLPQFGAAKVTFKVSRVPDKSETAPAKPQTQPDKPQTQSGK
jgi:hypothetical protein